MTAGADPVETPMITTVPQEVSHEALNLWKEVANGLEKNQTVVWKSAVESLDTAKTYFVSPDARHFVEKYMSQIIGILIEQVPGKIGPHERNCVQDSLTCAIKIVASDLRIQVETKGTCTLLTTLSHCLNKKKQFYKGAKGAWNANQMQGLPDFRLKVIEHFRAAGGFTAFAAYLGQKTASPKFPAFDVVHHVLVAVADASVSRLVENPKVAEEDAINLGKAVMASVDAMTDDRLKKMPTESLHLVLRDLQSIFDAMIGNHRESSYEFYEFWRDIVLRLIKSPSLPLRLFGWEQVAELVDAAGENAPPPRAFVVSGAGVSQVNGRYEYGGEVTADGYQKTGSDTQYVRQIPDDPSFGDNAGKKLTLFRCTMRSQQKWWFLSHADEEQPGTDRDVDYYQHKSKEHEEDYPPPSGWVTCRVAGADPPPNLKPDGLLVPSGEESNTLEHQLAKWAIENEIVENVLGDTTIHREVVSRSTVLVNFLASMCNRGDPDESNRSEKRNEFCLQPSHLLFAWKTCTRKADAAVATEVYKLLVSILPRCPPELAVPLLEAVQSSLEQPESEGNLLDEVGEFSSLLASNGAFETKAGGSTIKNEVREAILNLLWALLSNPEVSRLKSHDDIKRYVTLELQKDVKGDHRTRFLHASIAKMSENVAKSGTEIVDEDLAQRVPTLLYFVLDACPRAHASTIISKDNASLPNLMFMELIAYLERRSRTNLSVFRRNSVGQGAQVDTEDLHSAALRERLTILRNVYGLSGPASEQNEYLLLNVEMIRRLWTLCDEPADRELVMIFLASASTSTSCNTTQFAPNTQGAPGVEVVQNSAFTMEVGMDVFVDMFCSTEFKYDHMGEEAYKSFQTFFTRLYGLPTASDSSKSIALDAVWSVCLTAISDSVVARAMRDLLRVYATDAAQRAATSPSQNAQEGFGTRMLEYLIKVKGDIDKKAPFATRSVQRCLRILNTAVGRSESDGYSMTSSTLLRLSRLPLMVGYNEASRCLPHGMQGQVCYRQIGVTIRRTQVQNLPATQNYQDAGQSSAAAQRPPSPMTKLFFFVHPLETLAAVKRRVATQCQCKYSSVRPVQINGRASRTLSTTSAADPAQLSLSVVPEDSVMDELGVVEGCEMVFVLADRPTQANGPVPASTTVRSQSPLDLTSVFFSENNEFGDKLFDVLLSILDSLKGVDTTMRDVDQDAQMDPNKLVWDLLMSMPTNASVGNRVRNLPGGDNGSSVDDAMELEPTADSWAQLVDSADSNRAVYSLLTIDAILESAPEVFSILPEERRAILVKEMNAQSAGFREKFLEAGGFQAVVNSFSSSQLPRQGNAAALRILKSCIFGSAEDSQGTQTVNEQRNAKQGDLLKSLASTDGLLRSLTSMVVADKGISSSTIMDVLRFLRLLFQEPGAAESFVSLADGMAERFLVTVLWRDDDASAIRSSAMTNSALVVRRSAHDLILETPFVCDVALSWLIDAVDQIDVSWENAKEHFDALEKLIRQDGLSARSKPPSAGQLERLATIICKKIASCPKPSSESELGDFSTSVLCGCLKLLCALVLNSDSAALSTAVNQLVDSIGTQRWSLHATSGESLSQEDATLTDLMGVIFDGLLSPHESSSVAMCFDTESRQHGFRVIHAAARSPVALLTMVSKVNSLVVAAAPNLKHRYGEFGGDSNSRSRITASRYSGLRNQGCTCYMNSVLQQLFMMPELKDSMCAAPLPSSLRSTNGSAASQGNDLIGKKISVQWDNGITYDAIVEAFNSDTGMHTIRYCPVQVATVSGGSHQQVHPEDITGLPPVLADEFVLSQGRPGKETGVFEIVTDASNENDGTDESSEMVSKVAPIEESPDEKSSRHLLEQFQRTLIHLEKGSRGKCFDPRALVEACACLKLEFDVWQQNDASEFATKLLDRLEISLKKWAPDHFHYLDHTFGLKQTKQKICKTCGMKSNREEKLLNIDCQIRCNHDIHEALGAMTEVELMEGSNKVFCDQCKENTDTVLRTAISALPNMLILSLKRFDLDFTTFETVKLNSRCSFGQTLNMKPYTLAGMEEAESDSMDESERGLSPMDTGDTPSTDDDYEYRLAGVLVHAGVAQGGHYYSFIKDRNEDKWYRFDDEDVTPFDSSSIETECFGGKVKKETKWPNGQVHTVEQEQYANALMLFYEKVRPSDPPTLEESKDEETGSESVAMPDVVDLETGYEAYEPDVRRSNATHRWQSFLFDREFHDFLKEMLQLCRPGVQSVITARSDTWKPPVVNMLLSFVFDVLLYSSDKGGLNDWTLLLEAVLLEDKELARAFVDRLSAKCATVSDNWVRTFFLECPDLSARSVAVRVFTAAFQSCISVDSELSKLEKWTAAWNLMTDSLYPLKRAAGEMGPFPSHLKGEWAVHEDSRNLRDFSSLGTIISFLNVLLDALPRSSRFHAETVSFIRNLAATPVEGNGDVFRRALVAAQIPARLVVLIARERAPQSCREAFPALAVSTEAAQTQVRPETSSSIMTMNSSHGMGSAEIASSRNPSHSDYVIMIETILCTGGLYGVGQAAVVRDVDDMPRGRHRFALSERAEDALSKIFGESISTGAPGMGRAEIERYLSRCAQENATITNQKINDMMAKYPTTKGNHDPRGDYLSMEGFQAYYRDTVQTNDVKLRLDLHAYGFRPDLSRRSHESRFINVSGRDADRRPAESVAIDVAEILGNGSLNIGDLGRTALSQTFHLFAASYSMSEQISQYLIAAVTYRQKAEGLINHTLLSIHRTPNDWNGNEMINQSINILAVICSIPDEERDFRISKVMTSAVQASRSVEYGAGLLSVLRACYRSRQSNQYNDEFHWNFERYISIIKELRRIYPVYVWMNERSDQWSFVEQDIQDNRRTQRHAPQVVGRPDYTSRRLQHDHHNDSDVGFNDSEEDDDSQLSMSGSPYSRNNHNFHQQSTRNNGPTQIIVQGAGNECVNGVFQQNGYFENTCRYGMEGTWRNNRQHFSIFQCNVSNNTKHWYISIVPYESSPGTASDIDFYTAPATADYLDVPPQTGWVKSQEGNDPAPRLEFRWSPGNSNHQSPQPQQHPQHDEDLRGYADDEDDENYNTGMI